MARFSVVIATYNRGRHILPTLHSALQQTYEDFEILIVGDACTDDTHSIVQPYLSEHVRWSNLPSRGGSQSFPNNEGIAQASGDFVAYLGHDDIWTPDHLAELAKVFASVEKPDFVSSGCIYHTPQGSGFSWVTSLIENSQAAADNFLPPSSLAHTLDAAAKVGDWRSPTTIRHPVDADFQDRAIKRGLTFASTGRVTVHKFAAGHRYLSYLHQTSFEQEAMLHQLGDPDFPEFVDAIVWQAKQAGTYMILGLPNRDTVEKGSLYRRNAQNKGDHKPPLQRFDRNATLEQGNDGRALDWYGMSGGEPGLRWSGPNPRPKILLPFSGDDLIVCSISACHPDAGALRRIAIRIDGQMVPTRCIRMRRAGERCQARLDFLMNLKVDEYSMFEFVQPDAAIYTGPGGRQSGVGVATIKLRTASRMDKLRAKVSAKLRAILSGSIRTKEALN